MSEDQREPQDTLDDRLAKEVPDPTADPDLPDTEPLEMDATADEEEDEPLP